MVALTALFGLALFNAASAGQHQSSLAPPSSQRLLIRPNDAAITWSGRSIVGSDGSRTFDWAAQTILLSISGTTNITLRMNESKTNRYAIYNYTQPGGGAQLFPWGPHGSPTEVPRKLLLTTNSSTNSSSNGLAPIEYPLFTGLLPTSHTHLLIFKTSEPNGICACVYNM